VLRNDPFLGGDAGRFAPVVGNDPFLGGTAVVFALVGLFGETSPGGAADVAENLANFRRCLANKG